MMQPERTIRRAGRWGVALTLALRVAATAAQPDSPPAASAAPPDSPAAAAGALRATGDPVQLRDSGLLDLHVRDLEIATVLELLSYKARANIVTSTKVNGRVSANLYNVTLEQALAAILTPNQYGFRAHGNTVFVGTPEELATLAPPPATRVFHLRYLRPREAATAVRAVLSDDARVVEGGTETGGATGRGGTAATDELGPASNDYLVITAPAAELDAAARLLAELDRRPQQVLIEATILRATLNENHQFGIDFTVLSGVDFRNVGSRSDATTNLRTGPLPPARLEDTTMNFNQQFTQNVNPGGFTFGVISNNIAAFVRALEGVTDVTVVANPKIVALNKQPGEVIVGRRDGYLTTTVTETAAIQTVDFLETGTQIRFRPVINDDGTVRLSVHPKDSNGGLTAANLPFEETTEARADILVRDGDTVLIGGLFRERTVNSRSQIPVLGNIPGAGLLFGSRNEQTIREEVIILLTVHIIRDTPAEQEQFRQLLDDVERIRVGSRRGLVGTGRERLAQAYYREALKQLERGRWDAALLNVRMALHNQPRHVPALKLREDLLGRRVWDEDGTRMRTFIWDLIDPARGPTPPRFGRPPEAGLPPGAENGGSP